MQPRWRHSRVINPFVNSFSFIARSVTNTALAICTSAIKSSLRQQAYVKCKHRETSASILVTLTMLDSAVCELKLIFGPCDDVLSFLSYVALEEQRWRSRAWQVSQTLTGLGEAGSGSSLSEQALQKISPQFLQWCCSNKDKQESFQLKGVLLFFWFGSDSK